MNRILLILFFLLITTSRAFSLVYNETFPKILTIDKAIKIALEKNNNITIAKKEVERAKALLTQAKAKLFPSLGLDATYAYQTKLSTFSIGGANVTVGQKETYGSQLTLNQTLFAGGKIIRGVQAANIYLDIAKTGLEWKKREITFNVIKAFYDCLLTKEGVRLNQEIVKRLEEHYKSVKIRYEKGLAPDIELLNTKVELENAKLRLEEIENNCILSIKTLKQVLNTENDFKIDGQLAYNPCIIEDKNILKEKVLNYYPPLNQLRKKIEIDKKKISIAKGGYLPSLILSSSYSLKQSSGSFSYSGPEGSLNTALLLSIPLFKGFQTVGETREAKTSLIQTQREYYETTDLVSLQFDSSYNKLIESMKNIKGQALSLKKAEKVYQITLTRYNYGLNSNLDLIDAHLALSQARVSYKEAVHNFTIAKAELEKLTGTIFQSVKLKE